MSPVQSLPLLTYFWPYTALFTIWNMVQTVQDAYYNIYAMHFSILQNDVESLASLSRSSEIIKITHNYYRSTLLIFIFATARHLNRQFKIHLCLQLVINFGGYYKYSKKITDNNE